MQKQIQRKYEPFHAPSQELFPTREEPELDKKINELEKRVKKHEKEAILKKLEEDGDKLIGLKIEKEHQCLSDISNFCLILRDSYQDAVNIKEPERKFIEPPIVKISYESPVIIIIDPWFLAVFGVLGYAIQNYPQIKEIVKDFKNSKLVRNITKKTKELLSEQGKRKYKKEVLMKIKIELLLLDRKFNVLKSIEIKHNEHSLIRHDEYQD